MRGREWLAAVVVAASSVGGAAAEEAPRSGAWIGLSGFYHNVTNSYGDWRGVSARAVLPAGARDTWTLDAMAQEAFRDDGAYGAVADTHSFSERWYGFAAVGGGTGDFYFPDLRLDAALGRRWLPSQRLVTTFGGSFALSKDGHRDTALTASLIAYPAEGLMAELGGRVNRSEPGAVYSGRGFLTLSFRRESRRALTLRLDAGREGYQLTGPDDSHVGFSSTSASFSWREWLGPGWGADLGLETHDNPFYTRTGASLGVFREW